MPATASRPRAVALSLLLAGACAPTAPGSREAPLIGVWAGEHARLDVTVAGGAIEYDCAHGSLAGPLRTDGAGRFVAAGFHVREHGGPVRFGEAVDSVPAVYTGAVAGDRMTLRVVAGADSLGPFVLQRGGVARLYKCL